MFNWSIIVTDIRRKFLWLNIDLISIQKLALSEWHRPLSPCTYNSVRHKTLTVLQSFRLWLSFGFPICNTSFVTWHLVTQVLKGKITVLYSPFPFNRWYEVTQVPNQVNTRCQSHLTLKTRCYALWNYKRLFTWSVHAKSKRAEAAAEWYKRAFNWSLHAAHFWWWKQDEAPTRWMQSRHLYCRQLISP